MLRSIEVHDVEPGSALRLPLKRHLQWVVAVDGLLVEIALEQAHAPAAADVYGWNNFDSVISL